MTPKEQYDQMLDDLDPISKEHMLSHVPFSRIVEEFDQTAYNCGLSDFMATCEQCGCDFEPDDTDAESICEDCATEDDDED